MSSILKIEFEKLRKTKSFWAIMLFLVFITSTVAITRSLEVGGSVGGINPAEPRAENGYFFEDNSAYAISLYNVWIGSISGDLFFTTIFYFILPLAATLPFSFSLSDESKSGYLRQMTLKKGQMRYYFAKYIVTFTSGFLLAAIPLLINVIITACYIPAYKPDPLEQLYSGQCKYVCKECGSSNEWTNSLGRGNNYSLDFQHMYAGWLFVFEKFGYYK